MKLPGRMATVRRRRLSRIGTRLLAFNLLLVFLPIAGILYLDVYEQELLQTQERGMVQQARLAAAALGGRDEVDGANAAGMLQRLGRRSDSRIRVYAADGRLLADSARAATDGSDSAAERYARAADRDVRARALYRLGAWLERLRMAAGQALRQAFVGDLQEEAARETVRTIPAEVQEALVGRYGAATRVTPGQRSLTLNSAVPVRSGGRVVGAVVVSQSTYRILGALYAVRLRVFQIVIASVLAAALLTAFMAARIVRPLVKLRHAAAALGERGTVAPATFPGSARRDEIGDLARGLEELTRRLDAHVRLLESFAADVSHEFKNPLTSIRTAAEMLGESADAADRHRFLAMLTRDVDRLERLVSGVHELARIDARLGHEETAPIDLAAFVADFVAGRRLTSLCPIELELGDKPGGYKVRASPERLAQVLENLLANATSFAPPETAVVVSVVRNDGWCSIMVTDRGPGIPSEHLERVFDRFFTYRPDGSGGGKDHAGLGLAIARAIVEGYGGSLTAANAAGGGASFEIRLPSVSAVSAEPALPDAVRGAVQPAGGADPSVRRAQPAGGRTDYRSREIS